MTDPPSPGLRRDTAFDVFPDALSALPLPALTLVMPTDGPGGVPAGTAAAMPGVAVSAGRVTTPRRATGAAAGRTPVRSAAAPVPFGPPTGPVWGGFPAPGQPSAAQPPPIAAAAPYSRPAALPRQTRPAQVTTPARGVLAPGTGRRPVAGVGYTAPTTTSSSVIRPPAYLPQNSGLAGLRAAVQQARGTVRPPASPPSAVRPASPTSTRPGSATSTRPGSPSTTRPAPPTDARRKGRASSAWALFVFVLIFLVSSGAGQQILHAISQLLHHR